MVPDRRPGREPRMGWPSGSAAHPRSRTWRSSRRDCGFADPSAEQTSVTCNAGLTTSALVILTVMDSTGAEIARSGSLACDKTPRPATVSRPVDGVR